VETRTIRQNDDQPEVVPIPEEFDEDDTEMRPIPMVDVSRMDPSDDDDLSSYMEVSQFAVPAPNDGFIPVVHRGSQLRSSNQSIRSAQTTVTNESIALQQALIEASIQNRHSLELDSKFDKLDKAENFDWWHRQVRGRLQHEAWQNILAGGEPNITVDSNRAISNKLCQRLNQAMTATVGEAIGGTYEYEGLGLELFQAIIHHFIPSDSVNLPTIFTEWNELHQKKDELAAVFSGRVTKLAARSKRAGQEYTDVSQILTFVDGLHNGFDDFAKDYFSGRVTLSETSLRDTTALAKTLELTMDKKVKRHRDVEPTRRGRARRAGGATPDNESVDVTSGPLSRSQVDALFANFKCPLHRVNNHTCLDCFSFGDQGFVITKKPTGAGRRVSGPAAAVPAPAPSAPTPAPAPAPAANVEGSAQRVSTSTIREQDDDDDDDDDVSVASSIDDFGVDYVIGSSKRVGKVSVGSTRLHAPRSKPFTPYRRTPSTRVDSLQPPSSIPKLWCVMVMLSIALCLFLSPSMGTTTAMPGLVSPVIQGLGLLYVSPTSRLSTCLGDAKMAQAVSNGSLGRIQRATNPNGSQACVDSGCTTDMCPLRQSFVKYTPLDNCYVTIANSEKIKCAGRGTVFLQLGNKAVKLANVLHVPDLEMTLLSVRSHRRRGQGCSFVADESGCFLTFPKFVLEIDDTEDCVLPCAVATRQLIPDYCESEARNSSRYSRADAVRISAKRIRGTMLVFTEGAVRRVGVPPSAATDPAELLKVPLTQPKTQLHEPALERRVAPPVRPCEIPESSAAATIRYTPQQLHKLLGCRNLADYKQLQHLGTGVHVADLGEPLLSVGSVVNIQRGRAGRSLTRPTKALDTVGMDI
jgi:hypothetical protein